MFALPAKVIVRRHRWVLAAWATLAVLLAPRACHVQQVLAVRGTSDHSTESHRSAILIKEAFPSPVADYVAIVVRGPVAQQNRRFRAVLDSISAAVAHRPYVSQVITLRSIGDSALDRPEQRITFLIAALAPDSTNDITKNYVPDLRAEIARTLDRLPGGTGFDVKVTGDPALDYDLRTISGEDTAQGERRLVPLTLVVLVLAFGALVAALLPLAVGVLAITIALGIVTIAARFETMSVFVLNITTMVGLGVGIDYSLLIVTRFREELNRGLAPADAAIRTVQTAGSAVVTSGLTVVVGFAALLTTPIVETQSVGVGGLLVVGVAVLLATTFLPAMLVVLGRNIDQPRWLGHRPWRAIAGGGLAIGLLTLPLTQIRIGLPASNWFPSESESGQGLNELREIGASGVIQPMRIAVRFPEGESALSAKRLAGLKALSDSLRRDPRVKEVRGVATLRPMSRLQLVMFYSDPQAARARYPQFFNAYLSADNRTTLVDVIPSDTVSLTGLMDDVRDARAVIARGVRGLQGAEIAVGGFAAASVDLQNHLLSGMPGIVALILAITAIMLFFAFNSLLVALKAVVLNCLSVGAAFGVTVLVFQHGYGGQLFGLDGPTQAIFVIVPVLVFATVFGLSMDYEVFLLARVKEVFDKTGRNDHATMEGLSATASTITFAAAIMIAVFGVFAFSRVLAVQFIGFGLAVAVLLDATLIRMVLVPAIMHIAGRWNWWPGVRAPKLDAGGGGSGGGGGASD